MTQTAAQPKSADKLKAAVGGKPTDQNLPAQKPKTMGDSVGDFIAANADKIKGSLPSVVTLPRLQALTVSAINRTPALAECSKLSLVSSFVTSTQLGLEVNTPLGHAYLVPFDRSIKTADGWKKVKEAQFVLGYQGLIELAYRSGMYKMIYAESVYSNDDFTYSYGLTKHLTHIPTDGEQGDFVGCYAVFHLKNGGMDFKYWPAQKIIEHAAKYSKSWDAQKKEFRKGSAWAENFASMAKVPVLKDLLKIAPKSIEFAQQISLDGSVKAEFKPNMADARNEEIEAEYEVMGGDGEIPMSKEEKDEIERQERETAGGQGS